MGPICQKGQEKRVPSSAPVPVNKPDYINPSTPLHHLAITLLCIILSFRHFHKHSPHETFSFLSLITLTWPDLSSDIEGSDRGIGVVGSVKSTTHFCKFTHMNMYMFWFWFCSRFGVHFQVANWNQVCAGRLEFGWAHSKRQRTLLGLWRGGEAHVWSEDENQLPLQSEHLPVIVFQASFSYLNCLFYLKN